MQTDTYERIRLQVLRCIIVLNVFPYDLALAAQTQPNVVIIYGDDVGYADVGVNGATQIATPNIDALAVESLNFTDGHCSASTCTPSRFSMLTGVYAFRHNVRVAPPNAALLIPPEALTLPKLFKMAGYQTGIVGKWHLGLGTKERGPNWNVPGHTRGPTPRGLRSADMDATLFDAQVTFCFTGDLDRTAEFYEQVLGLPLALDQGRCRIYRTGATGYLGFCLRDEAPRPEGVILTLVTDDVDGWHERLAARGVAIEKPPTANPEFEIYHFFFRDPDGYLLEIQRFDDPRWRP